MTLQRSPSSDLTEAVRLVALQIAVLFNKFDLTEE